VALELAAREPDTTSLRLRIPTQMTAKARADVHHGPQFAYGCQGSNLSDQARRPTHTTLNRLPDHAGRRCLTAPAPLEGSQIQGPGITGLASPVELPLIEQLMTGQEARRHLPSQARPHDCSSTTQDSRRLGRDSKTNLKSLDPELDNRSTTDSIHRS
jgi:hypothetical protein